MSGNNNVTDSVVIDNGPHALIRHDTENNNVSSTKMTNSFQITSVTRSDQGDDSFDDLDESHTEDISCSDILDNPSTADGYNSDDLNSPDTNLNNNNLTVEVTPTFSTIVPVAGGVTMMTSKSESPISAQVPIMNPLPKNWQRRFKVVKIVSSEPFRKGRWLCMDFKDPPEEPPDKKNGMGTPPAIHVTNYDSEDPYAILNPDRFPQVYEIPIMNENTNSNNKVMGQSQHMYGIILPGFNYAEQLTLDEQEYSVHSLLDPYKNLLSSQMQPVPMIVNNCLMRRSPPSSYGSNVSDVIQECGYEQRHSARNGLLRSRTSSLSRQDSHPSHNGGYSKMNGEVHESESTAPSGTNTVAIDNKIEQAMDLVKSHLMFAVREEVEVLKEKITELLERINLLETENDILRANASAETLNQLPIQNEKGTVNTTVSPPST